MEDKQISASESLELITAMINNTKKRMELGQGNILLLWGYVSAIVALVVMAGLLITRNVLFSWLWFLIPVIGYGLMFTVLRKRQAVPQPVTYVDRITSNVWASFGALCFVVSLVCVGFSLFGKDTWTMMFIFPVLGIGACTLMQGFIIEEKSMMLGGFFGLLCGIFFFGCRLADVRMMVIWAIPLFIVCMVVMLIIPGHILNRKAKKSCCQN